MKKNTLLLLLLSSPLSYLYTAELALIDVAHEDFHDFLRPGTPTANFPHPADDIDIKDEDLCQFSNDLLRTLRRFDEVSIASRDLLQDPALDPHSPETEEKGKKEGTKGALIGAAVVVPVVLFAGAQTRSPDMLIVGALAAGIGVCATGGIGWMLWGNYMKTIIKFKGSLQAALGHMGELQGQVEELKRQQRELGDTTVEAVKLSKQVLEQMPTLKGISGDNARLASVMQLLLARQQQLEKQFLDRMGDRLTETEIADFQAAEETYTFSAGGLERVGRQQQAVAAYNKRKHFWQTKAKRFTDIPEDWRTHFMDDAAGFDASLRDRNTRRRNTGQLREDEL